MLIKIIVAVALIAASCEAALPGTCTPAEQKVCEQFLAAKGKFFNYKGWCDHQGVTGCDEEQKRLADLGIEKPLDIGLCALKSIQKPSRCERRLPDEDSKEEDIY